ncbi:MAG: hypothetical protein K9M84_04320 [Spirochaetia bacterium]|nr:hypothetical protein [Spirochaetia bacterium]
MRIKTTSSMWLAFGNDVSLIAVLAVNALANILPINGVNTGQVSDSYPNLFTPIGFTFSIWGVIYVLLIIFAVYQSYLAFHPVHPDKSAVRQIGPWFMISSAANLAWILCWHYGFIGFSLIIMLVILASLIMIYLRLSIGTLVVRNLVRYFIHIPMSIYLGWIAVATIANISALLASMDWNGFGIPESFWTALVITAAVVLALISMKRYHDIYYAAVASWALIGIAAKHISFYQSTYPLIIVFSITGALLIAVGIIYLAVKGKVYK